MHATRTRWVGAALASALLLSSTGAFAQRRAPGLPGATSNGYIEERQIEAVEYQEGQPIPPGHHLVKKSRPGLIAGGITLLVVGLVGGGVVTALLATSDCETNRAACTTGSIVASVAGLGLSIGGGAMLAAGMAPTTYVVPDGYGRLHLSPTLALTPPPARGGFAAPRGASFGLIGRF
jgi:hypothetical protein